MTDCHALEEQLVPLRATDITVISIRLPHGYLPNGMSTDQGFLPMSMSPEYLPNGVLSTDHGFLPMSMSHEYPPKGVLSIDQGFLLMSVT